MLGNGSSVRLGQSLHDCGSGCTACDPHPLLCPLPRRGMRLTLYTSMGAFPGLATFCRHKTAACTAGRRSGSLAVR